MPDKEAATEFYQHNANWSNRMILGDSLQVMASLAEREGLRGQVQCIYIDPPYGIKFNSNFQWSTTSRNVSDGNEDHVSREPEQVKAFRDTWRDGVHSYLTYLRDRLTVARDLLSDTGSVFVQIGDENLHRIRAILDEVFGDENFVSNITIAKTTGQTADLLPGVCDYILWFAKKREHVKFRKVFADKGLETDKSGVYRWVVDNAGNRKRIDDSERNSMVGQADEKSVFRIDNMTSQKPPGNFAVVYRGKTFGPGKRFWATGEIGMGRLKKLILH